MLGKININNQNISLKTKSYFIADIAANHDGSLSKAIDLINMAAENGADAAKFQNFIAETIVSDYGFKRLNSISSHQSSWKKSVFEIYKDASIPLEWTKELKKECDKAKIDYLTTPYDLSLINELDEYVCAWKLGSGDITWHDNIANLAKKNKPILIATGASNLDEVKKAYEVAKKFNDQISIMQCNTNYTASLENFKYISLNVLKTYSKEFPDTVLGLSDHTPGHSTVLGAITLGARIIEKHFTNDNNLDGPDHKFSMNPKTWKNMIEASRELENALGVEDKIIMKNEIETSIIQRRAIRSSKDLKKGDTLLEDDLTYLRPCPEDALPPYKKNSIIGKKILKNINDGDIIKESDLA
tara:strand:- start:440 stop:1510 length:1071 start_codon:yes stop_codon:yes gene_type:complete